MKKLLVIMLIAMTLTSCKPYKADCIYTRGRTPNENCGYKMKLKDGWFVTDVNLNYSKGEAVLKIENDDEVTE